MGLAILALAAVLRLVHVLPGGPVAVAAAVGAWLTLKDARDLIPRWRDTASWSVGPHRRRRPLRPGHPADWVPWALGGVVVLAGAAEIVTALRHPGTDGPAPFGLPADPSATHALALPAGLLLVVAGTHLVRRRRGACRIAIALLAATGAVALLRRDLDGVALAWATAAVLVWARGAFTVGHEPDALRSSLRRLPVVTATTFATAAATVAAAAGHASPDAGLGKVLATSGDLMVLRAAPLTFSHPFGWVPSGIALMSVAAVLAVSWPLLRPLGHPSELPGAPARRRAAELVRRYGEDTLSFFKLRGDLHYRFSEGRTAFVGYRVRCGVLVVSGDPVGAPEAFPALLADLFAFAAGRGLRVAVLGAGPELRDIYVEGGLRSLYLGDEAIVDTRTFSLEGREIRKVRQSVSRLLRAGYSVELRSAGDLQPCELEALDGISARWRAGAPERGFCMAMDRLDGAAHPDSLVLTARDAEGTPRGFLHLVPCAGGRASLSLMRRDPGTPNGLTEFMVTQAIALMRDRGVHEISLNFATFGRFLGEPRNGLERLAGRVVRVGDRWFQIERLRRFNEKFSPRWQPRYLIVDSWLSLPRTALAAMALEGHISLPGAGGKPGVTRPTSDGAAVKA